MPDGIVPVEEAERRGRLPRPQDPSRKDAVKERLHQSGPEEGRSPVAFKLHAQRFFQRLAQCCQRRRIAGPFHPGQARREHRMPEATRHP